MWGVKIKLLKCWLDFMSIGLEVFVLGKGYWKIKLGFDILVKRIYKNLYVNRCMNVVKLFIVVLFICYGWFLKFYESIERWCDC